MGIFERVFGCKKKETVHPDLSAARAGDCNARFSYGKACICRSQDSAAIGEGLEWLMRAALKGHTQAQAVLGIAFAVGQGAPQHEDESLAWLLLALDNLSLSHQEVIRGYLDVLKGNQSYLERKAAGEQQPGTLRLKELRSMVTSDITDKVIEAEVARVSSLGFDKEQLRCLIDAFNIFDNNREPMETDSEEPSEQSVDEDLHEIKDKLSEKSMKLSTTFLRLRKLIESVDRDEIFSTIIEIVVKALDADRVQLLLNDEKNGKLVLIAAEGMTARNCRNTVVSYEQNCIPTFLAQPKFNELIGMPGFLGVKECMLDPRIRGLVASTAPIKTVLAAPIYVENKVFAIVNVEKMKNPDYTKEDQNLIATCADIAGLVIKNAKLLSAMTEELLSTKRNCEKQIKRNEELNKMLGQIVPATFKGADLLESSVMKPGGSKCKVTVLFSNIRGFTNMLEHVDSNIVLEHLNLYFIMMSDILAEMKGTLDKYMGDQLLAFFGDPVAMPDDPLRAVLCGYKMLEALAKLQPQWEKEGKPSISIGIGINTGEATIGTIGSEKHLSHTVIGADVNLAAFVMAEAKPMELLITRSTYEHVKVYFLIEQMKSIMVKGKATPVEIFRVNGVKHGAIFEKAVNEIQCVNCGEKNGMQTKFCNNCGSPLI